MGRKKSSKTVLNEVRAGLEELLSREDGLNKGVLVSMLTMSRSVVDGYDPAHGKKAAGQEYESVVSYLLRTRPAYFVGCSSEASKQVKAQVYIKAMIKARVVKEREKIGKVKFYIKNDAERKKIDDFLNKTYDKQGKPLDAPVRSKKKKRLVTWVGLVRRTGFQKRFIKENCDLSLLGPHIVKKDKGGNMVESGYAADKVVQFCKFYGL